MRRVGIAFGIVLAACVAWLASRQDLEPAPPTTNAVPSTEPAPAAATELPPATTAEPARATGLDAGFLAQSLVTPEAAVEAAADDDSRAGVLRGRLTVRQQPWEHPAGVEIRLTGSWLDSVVPTDCEPGTEAPSRDDVRTTTDRNGFFAFRLVPPSTELFFLIGHGTEWQDYQKVPKLPRAAETLDLGDLFVDQRGEIVGRVVTYGQGLPNVLVRAVDDPLLDGASGFEDVMAARSVGTETFTVPGATRDGPLPAWVVRRDRYLPFPVAITDHAGNFRLRGVRPGNHNVFATAAAPDFANGRSDGVLVASGRTTDLGAITVKPGRTVYATFVDERRQPWIGAEVSVLHAATGFGVTMAHTDAHGAARLHTFDGPRGQLVFGLPGGEGPWFDLAWPEQRELAWLIDGQEMTFTVRRPTDFAIALVDEGNRAITGGRIRLYAQSDAFRPVDRLLPAGLQPRETTPGRYECRLPCNAVLVASAPGFAPAIAPISPTGNPLGAMGVAFPVTMVPLQRATVFVHTLRGAPVAGASVRVQVHANPELKFAGAQWQALANDRVLLGRTDDRGELEVPIWPTQFSFQADHRDFAPNAGARLQPSPGQRIDLLLLGGGEVRGTLTMEARPAPAGLRVRARQRPPEGNPLAKNAFLDERVAVTGADGSFALRRLVAGIWELTPEVPRAPSATRPAAPLQKWSSTKVQLDEGQELHLALELQADAMAPIQLQGVVTLNGATLPGALIRLRELDPEKPRERNQLRRRLREQLVRGEDEALLRDETAPWQRCTTDVFGDYRFRELAAGSEHELRIDIPSGGRLQFAGRRIVRAGAPGQPTRLDVAIGTSQVRLSCDYQGRPLRDRMLRLRQVTGEDTETARFDVLLDGDGQTLLENLPAGSWTIEPRHGGRCEPGSIEVPAGGAVAFTISVRDR